METEPNRKQGTFHQPRERVASARFRDLAEGLVKRPSSVQRSDQGPAHPNPKTRAKFLTWQVAPFCQEHRSQALKRPLGSTVCHWQSAAWDGAVRQGLVRRTASARRKAPPFCFRAAAPSFGRGDSEVLPGGALAVRRMRPVGRPRRARRTASGTRRRRLRELPNLIHRPGSGRRALTRLREKTLSIDRKRVDDSWQPAQSPMPDNSHRLAVATDWGQLHTRKNSASRHQRPTGCPRT